ERGAGVSRFLPSVPAENDITTALGEVLADWSAPVFAGLTLEVNRTGVEAAGRQVAILAPGPASGIDLGDLPAGRPVWVAGRVPLGDPLALRLRTSASEVLAECRAEAGDVSGLKPLFGASRVRRLEYLITAGTTGGLLLDELHRLGFDTAEVSGGEPKVYAENAHRAAVQSIR